jgi:hypothetical protein
VVPLDQSIAQLGLLLNHEGRTRQTEAPATAGKVRAIAKQNAVTEAARAENTYAQLAALASAPASWPPNMPPAAMPEPAPNCACWAAFAVALQGIRTNTKADAARAQPLPTSASRNWPPPRRRAAVEDRAVAQAQIAAKREYGPQALGARRDLARTLHS